MNNLLNKTIVFNQDILVNNIDNEVVMMSLEQGKYYGLNEVGSRIWELIQKPLKVSELIDRLLQEYDILQDKCTEDTCAFIQQLEKDQIVTFE